MQVLDHSVIRVLNAHGITVGTGFVVADHLAVTCAHVVQAAGSACEQPICIEFYYNGKKNNAQVLQQGWSPPANDDVAFLRLASLPEGVTQVVTGSATQCNGHPYFSFGFAKLAGYDNRPVNGIIDGLVSVRDRHKQAMLQLQGEEIDQGLSGAPVLDTKTGRVTGMVSEYKDNEQGRIAWATTADTLALALAMLDPTFQLWPETFGPRERDDYLRYLIDTTQRLRLPDGNEMQLERIYVSLRTSEMKAAEWKAEQALHLDDVQAKQQAARGATKLTARDGRTFSATHEKGLLSLAEVVQRHLHVVILGDPGSGKTTMGRWLALQNSQALLQQETHVQVRADLIQTGAEDEKLIDEFREGADLLQPGAESETLLDLGPVRLPLMVRIADYAQARWRTEDGDSSLPLERFLGRHENRQDRPASLTQEVIQAMAWHYLALGQALVILDGLDEVADPDRRRLIMHEVKRFLQKPYPTIDLPARAWAENQVLLTSRIVGYQFEPLAELSHCTIEDMDELAITAFCDAWTRHVPPPPRDTETAETHAPALKTAIFEHTHPGVRALAGNPLLLTLLAQVYGNNPQDTLSTRRVALFEDVTRLMYAQRERFWDRSGIPPSRLNRALGAVAAHIHMHEPTSYTDEGGVRKALWTVLRDLEQVDAVLDAAREVSGFLFALGQGVYGFVHQSLQEYFVALHLTDIEPLDAEAAQRMINQLVTYSLDPNWREPVVLAVGIISRAKHLENRKLGDILAALLTAPDPASTVLPRRELLAAAACAECERLPRGIGHRIAENLLAFYTEREGRGRSPVMRERIRQAFHELQRCPAPVLAETEAVLCAAIEGADFDHRYAAIDLLIETRWDTPATAAALVTAWKTYADPAGSMLVALEGIQMRHPECFASVPLPLRQEQYAWVWEKVQSSQKWQAVLRVLYLSPVGTFAAEQVNRDSPLNEQLLGALNQAANEPPETFRYDLLSLAEHPGTARARDAAFILSALDDASWVKQGVGAADGQEQLLQPIFATLAYFLALARALPHPQARLRPLPPVRPLIGPPRFVRRVRISIRARDLDLALPNTLGPALNPNLVYDHDLALDPNLALHPNLEQLLQQARQQRAGNALVVEQLDSALRLLQTLEQVYQISEPLEKVWESLVIAYRRLRYFPSAQMKTELAQGDKRVTLEAIPRQPRSRPSSAAAPWDKRVTLEAMAQLVNDLDSMNDFKREFARLVLVTHQNASLLGKLVIERVAALAHQYRANPQIGTQLEWALQAIRHNVPDWIESWIEQASRSEQATPAFIILGSIRRVAPETFHILVQRLPHAPLRVKSVLLNSLSWLVRLDRVPERVRTSFSQDVLDCLRKEMDVMLRSALIEVLGHWQEKEAARAIAQALLRVLNENTDTQSQETRALTVALARLASIQPEIREPVKAGLSRERVHTAALPAIIRLSVAEPLPETSGRLPSEDEDHTISRADEVTSEAGPSTLGTHDNSYGRDFEHQIHTAPSFHPLSPPFEDEEPDLQIEDVKQAQNIRQAAQVGDVDTSRTEPEHPTPPAAAPSFSGRASAPYDLDDPFAYTEDIQPVSLPEQRGSISMDELDTEYRVSIQEDVPANIEDIQLVSLPEQRGSDSMDELDTESEQRGSDSMDELDTEYRVSIQEVATSLQAKLESIIPNPTSCLDALLDAGIDDDPWNDDYHRVLAIAVQRHLEQYPDLIPKLLARLEHALDKQDWPARRITLAAVAACTESLPAKLQQTAHGKLEALLIRGTTDAESHDSRRHALMALSYLRTITPAVVPALLAGCRDIEIVQQAAITAAERFQEIQGDVLSDLAPWLMGESVRTAYAVALLLGALGTATAREAGGMREQIVKTLVEALQNPGCRREVVIEGQNKGTLEDLLYRALLNVEGWVA